MEKDNIFFGENGITNTQANYIANLAKETYQTYENKLFVMSFYSETLNLIGTANQSLLSKGDTLDDLNSVPGDIEYIAQCKALIAYLREAIKARETLRKEIRDLDIDAYCRLMNIIVPVYPTRKEPLTEEDYYGSLNIKERNAYYTLEAQCATLGKFIHPKGALATARENLIQKLNRPHEASGAGRDTVIYNYEPTVNIEDVEKVFFSLQNKYRELQAQLNSIKFKCQTARETSELECQAEYVKACSDYKLEVAKISSEMVQYKKAKDVEIGKLKIVIPDKLKNVFDTISSLGKKDKQANQLFHREVKDQTE